MICIEDMTRMAVNGVEVRSSVDCSICGHAIYKSLNELGGTDIWDTRNHFTPKGNCSNRRDKNGC